MIVTAGLMALSPSTLIGNAQGQMYANEYAYDSNSYSYPETKSSHTDIEKISCVNDNKNINGIDIAQIPQDNSAVAPAANKETATPDAANTQNGNGLFDRINFERNLVNICVNVNDNEQVNVPPTCEDCFAQNLDAEDLDDLFPIPLEGGSIQNLQELCDLLERFASEDNKKLAYVIVTFALDRTASIDNTEREAVIDCLISLGLIEPLICEDCFSPLSEDQMISLLSIAQVTSIGAYCDRLTTTPNTCEETDDVLNELNQVTDIGQGQVDAIVDCLADIGVIIPPTECV
ncbi:MAG TPA: hypothetical protein VK250_04560 [Nitrososphaeraceae archaeon]|nr:hypothetical protein [Nitrososphaeraceae archaeon]